MHDDQLKDAKISKSIEKQRLMVEVARARRAEKTIPGVPAMWWRGYAKRFDVSPTTVHRWARAGETILDGGEYVPEDRT